MSELRSLSPEALQGLAIAYDADPELARWAAQHDRLCNEVAAMLDGYSIRLTPAQFSVQLTRLLRDVRATVERSGESGEQRARKALGLEE